MRQKSTFHWFADDIKVDSFGQHQQNCWKLFLSWLLVWGQQIWIYGQAKVYEAAYIKRFQKRVVQSTQKDKWHIGIPVYASIKDKNIKKGFCLCVPKIHLTGNNSFIECLSWLWSMVETEHERRWEITTWTNLLINVLPRFQLLLIELERKRSF